MYRKIPYWDNAFEKITISSPVFENLAILLRPYCTGDEAITKVEN